MRTLMPFFDKFVLAPKTWRQWVYRQFLPPSDALAEMNRLLPTHYEMYRILTKDWRNGTRHGVQWYEAYCAEIKRIVPEGNLLVFNNKQGWEPLVGFLGLRGAPQWAFPKVNSTADWDTNIGQMYTFIDQVVYWRAAKTAGAVLVAVCGVGVGLLYSHAWLVK